MSGRSMILSVVEMSLRGRMLRVYTCIGTLSLWVPETLNLKPIHLMAPSSLSDLILSPDHLRLPLQPLQRPFILSLEETSRLLQNLIMVLIQPLPFPIRQELLVNQLPTHWCHSHVFESQPGFLAEGMRGLDLSGHDDVCNVVNS